MSRQPQSYATDTVMAAATAAITFPSSILRQRRTEHLRGLVDEDASRHEHLQQIIELINEHWAVVYRRAKFLEKHSADGRSIDAEQMCSAIMHSIGLSVRDEAPLGTIVYNCLKTPLPSSSSENFSFSKANNKAQKVQIPAPPSTTTKVSGEERKGGAVKVGCRPQSARILRQYNNLTRGGTSSYAYDDHAGGNNAVEDLKSDCCSSVTSSAVSFHVHYRNLPPPEARLVDLEKLHRYCQQQRFPQAAKLRFRADGCVDKGIQQFTVGCEHSALKYRKQYDGPPFGITGDGDYVKGMQTVYIQGRCKNMLDLLKSRAEPPPNAHLVSYESFFHALNQIDCYGVGDQEWKNLVSVLDPKKSGFIPIVPFVQRFGFEFLKSKSMRFGVGADHSDGKTNAFEWLSSFDPEYSRKDVCNYFISQEKRYLPASIKNTRSFSLRKQMGKMTRDFCNEREAEEQKFDGTEVRKIEEEMNALAAKKRKEIRQSEEQEKYVKHSPISKKQQQERKNNYYHCSAAAVQKPPPVKRCQSASSAHRLRQQLDSRDRTDHILHGSPRVTGTGQGWNRPPCTEDRMQQKFRELTERNRTLEDLLLRNSQFFHSSAIPSSKMKYNPTNMGNT